MDWKIKLRELRLTSGVVQCDPSTPVADVREILQTSKIGCIVVSERRKVIGIFTERDYLMKVAGKERKVDSLPISKWMTKNPELLAMDDLVIDALQLMRDGGFRHVVVTDSEGRAEMVVSVKDVLMHILSTIDFLEDDLKDLLSCIA